MCVFVYLCVCVSEGERRRESTTVLTWLLLLPTWFRVLLRRKIIVWVTDGYTFLKSNEKPVRQSLSSKNSLVFGAGYKLLVHYICDKIFLHTQELSAEVCKEFSD